jgi:hypothetical protein
VVKVQRDTQAQIAGYKFLNQQAARFCKSLSGKRCALLARLSSSELLQEAVFKRCEDRWEPRRGNQWASV